MSRLLDRFLQDGQTQGRYRADPAQAMPPAARRVTSREPGPVAALLLCSALLPIYQPAVEATDQVRRELRRLLKGKVLQIKKKKKVKLNSLGRFPISSRHSTSSGSLREATLPLEDRKHSVHTGRHSIFIIIIEV